MKKSLIIVFNALIMAGILIFVVLYSRAESVRSHQRQIEHFENTTITMEHVTQNYLEGEQHVCDVWAHAIIEKGMTLEEAVTFVRSSHVHQLASAHLIYLDDLTGLREDGIAEIGYGILAEHQGQGYATEAVQAACRWAFCIRM